MKSKSKSTAYLLCYFLGGLGVHRFYLDKVLSGILMLITLGGLGIWWAIDVYLIASGRMRDKQGQELYSGPPDPHNPKAGFWVRLAAISVDGIIIGLIVMVVILLPAVVAMAMGILGSSETDQTMVSVAVFAVEILFGWFYFAIPLSHEHQATPGKRCFDLYVATRDGERVGLLRALWRTFCYVISAIPLYLGFIMAAFKNKRALHDVLAGTQVLYVTAAGGVQSVAIEPEAATVGAAVQQAGSDDSAEPASGRGPVMLMLLGVVLLLAAAALAVL